MQEFQNSTRRAISWFKQTHEQHRLTMNPPFQRNPVWTDAQKSYLIDTILRGYPIPELYIQETVDTHGNEHHTVVDGQQRLRACLEFIENRYALTEKDAPDWAEKKFDDLSGPEKQRIFGYNFIVRQLPEVPEEQLRIIFKRLNRNVVALNKQELRHATYWGPFIKSMEALSDRPFWTTSGIFTANDIRRMLDIEFISEIVVAYLHGLPNKKASLDKWYETYESEFPDHQQVENCFETVLAQIGRTLPNLVQTRWRKKSDFYSLFLVLAEREDDLPFSKSGRIAATTKLSAFGLKVDAYISSGATKSPGVRKYGDAVEKAASDLANREARANVLRKLLDGVS